SLFGCGKALNEGFFHILVLTLAVYLFSQGRIGFGDIAMFSVLYLNVMAPLNEVHRFIDEAHESSLRVGDLFELLREPVDRSFRPADPREPGLSVGQPACVTEDLSVVYPTRSRDPRPSLHGVSL